MYFKHRPAQMAMPELHNNDGLLGANPWRSSLDNVIITSSAGVIVNVISRCQDQDIRREKRLISTPFGQGRFWFKIGGRGERERGFSSIAHIPLQYLKYMHHGYGGWRRGGSSASPPLP